MARPKGSKNKPKDEAGAPQDTAPAAGDSEFRYSQQDLYQYRREADRYAEQAKESAGHLGSFTNNFIERVGADKTALTFWRRVMRMDRARGDTTIRHLIHMLTESNRMPEADLVDMAEQASAPPPPPPEEANVVRLQQGIKKLEGADAAGTYRVN